MKNVMLIMAGSLLAGASVFAQTDSTRLNQGTPTSPTVQPPATTSPYPQQNQYRREDMTIIQHDQLPSSLRETLGGTDYKGWENSTIYRNPTTGDYYLEMQRGSSIPPTGGTETQTTPRVTSPTSPPQNITGMENQNGITIYRFDRNGKAIRDDNRQGGGRDDN